MSKIIVSGSSSGIGRALSEFLLAQGHTVVGLARGHEKFRPNSEHYFPVRVDFSDLVTAEQQMKQLAEEHTDVDHIICSAGVGQFGCLEEFSREQIEHVIHVNFTSQALLIKQCLPGLKRRYQAPDTSGHGKIIFIGSEAALTGEKQGTIYCASKFALRGFAQALRKECATSGVTVSMLNPGFVNSPFFDTLRFSPECVEQHAIQLAQIVEVVALLLNQPSTCVTEEITLQPLQRRIKKKAK